MIVVKTKATLRIKENNRNKLVPLGSIFRGRTIEDLPEWLQEHITYFRSTPRCDTLLIREHAEIEQPIASKGVKKVKVVVNDVKADDKPLPEIKLDPKIQPKEVVELKVDPKPVPKPDLLKPAVVIEPPPELKKEVKKETKKPAAKSSRKKKEEKAPVTVKLKKRTPK